MDYQIGIRVQKKLLDELDAYSESTGCMNRSDAARDLIRTALRSWRKENVVSMV